VGDVVSGARTMKAKDYAKQFNDNPGIDSVCEIGVAFVREIAQIAKARNVSTMPGLLAILNEQNRKWAAFCRLTNGAVREDGLMAIVQELEPELYSWWRYENC
jgi:hypothetical protein